MSGIYDEFSGSVTADVLTFNPDTIPEPESLHIRMTRGERRIADELRKQFGGFKRVVIDVDGEQHEFSADSLIRLLESYEQVPELGECENDSERESCGEACNEIAKLLGRLRGVGNLHEFAELFDFSWHDDTDWTWHDVAARMADEIEAELCNSMDKSRWFQLFGMPEKAARTLARMCQGVDTCGTCPLFGAGLNHCKNDYTDFASIAEWLRGDAE